ncbi:hypothetical protein Tco_0623315 [Tanacetum coccineum]
MLKRELEKTKQEKEIIQLKIENFDNASKILDKLIGSQITDNSRKGVGFVSYNVVPPPHTGLFSPPKVNLSNSGLEEFQQPEFEGYGSKTSENVSERVLLNEVRESPDTPLVEKLVSKDKLEKKTVSPTTIEFVRPKQQEKPVRKPIKYAEMYRNIAQRAILMKTGHYEQLNNAWVMLTATSQTTVHSADQVVMSADSAVTYTSVHSEARSWSIPSEDPYEEAARQLLEQAPRSLEYVPDPIELEDHVPVYIPEPEHPEDLVPAEDEASLQLYYTILFILRTPPLLPIPLPAPSTSRRADIPEADTLPRKRLLLTTPRPGYVRSRESSEFQSRHHDAQKDRASVRAEIEVLKRERVAYEQESMETRQALARFEAYCRALEARVTVLETEVHRHEWQRQAVDDLAVQHIMRTQALEAGARVDTLEDTGSSS